VRPPPEPELVRRVLERVRAGDSFRAIGRDAGISDSTVRRWARDAGAAPAPPLIMRLPPPPLSDDVRAALPAELAALAARLDAEGARVVRRAIDALAATPDRDSDAPDPTDDMRGWMVHQIRRCEHRLAVAEVSQNSMAVKQESATLEKWASSLRQLDKTRDTDDIVIPRGALAERMARLRETVSALTTDAPRCVDCGRAIRASWADDTEGDDGE